MRECCIVCLQFWQINLYEDIKQSTLFIESYNVCYTILRFHISNDTFLQKDNDLIPPSPHACLLELDVWVNKALINTLAAADAPLGEDTEFDWAMHLGIMEIGKDCFAGA